MDLLTPRFNEPIQNSEIEMVQKQKQEYFLLGTFLRTKGLKLFGYNYLKDEVIEVDIKYSDTITLVPVDGELIPIDFEAQKCVVDSRFTYFEALKMETAIKRVEKYKMGLISDLCNLRKPGEIKFY